MLLLAWASLSLFFFLSAEGAQLLFNYLTVISLCWA